MEKKIGCDIVATLVYTVYKKWVEKKLATALLINIKGVFDHILKWQFLNGIIKLDIDGDFVNWTGTFLTDQKIQLVSDEYDNKKWDIENKISEGF